MRQHGRSSPRRTRAPSSGGSCSLAWPGIGSTELAQLVRLQDKVSILLTTEKPIYQPGQTIHVRALALDRRNGDAWATQAYVSRQLDPTDLAPAFRSLQEALALDSSNTTAWHYLAISLAESGDMDKALAAWHRSVMANPSYAQGLAYLGLGYYWRRQYDSASRWADSSIAVEPNYLLGRTTVGQVAVELGNVARGRAAFAAARRLGSDVEAVNTLAGSALAEARGGSTREARRILRRAEALATAYAPAPLHTAVYMAQAYAALGDAKHAIAWLRRYTPREDLHFQLHLRCDPPYDRASRRCCSCAEGAQPMAASSLVG